MNIVPFLFIVVGGALHKYCNMEARGNIYVVLCANISPEQKTIVRRPAEMDICLFMDLCTWIKGRHPTR